MCVENWAVGWQVTLCDPMWHVSSRSGVATLRTAIHLLLTYLLTYLLTATLERINTDYDPGSVVSTAQSNNNQQQLVYIGRRWRNFFHIYA